MQALDLLVLGLVVVVALMIVWLAGYVVYKLYRGQR